MSKDGASGNVDSSSELPDPEEFLAPVVAASNDVGGGGSGAKPKSSQLALAVVSTKQGGASALASGMSGRRADLLRRYLKTKGREYYDFEWWLPSFKLVYGKNAQCIIPGDAIHEELANRVYTVKTALTYVNRMPTDAANLACVAIGFVVSGPNYIRGVKTKKEYFGFNLAAKGLLDHDSKFSGGGLFAATYFDVRTAYLIGKSATNEALDAAGYKGRLASLARAAETTMTEISSEPPPRVYKDYKARDYEPRRYHHSEAAFMQYVLSEHGLNSIVERLRGKYVQGSQRKKSAQHVGRKVYAMVLHIHTHLYMCENCSELLIGLLRPDGVFVRRLTDRLQAMGFITSEKKPIRVSALVSGHKSGGHKRRKAKESDFIAMSEQECKEPEFVKSLLDGKHVLFKEQKGRINSMLRERRVVCESTLFVSGTSAHTI